MSAFFLEHPRETDLALFAGGESGPFARWRIERHVESCPQCQDIAANFFRLPDQLNELADLPSVDWKQMAMAIESGVRAEAAVGRPVERSKFLPPLTWQAGLVIGTVVVGVIVVQQIDRSEPELIASARLEAPAPAPVAEQQAAPVEELEAVTAEPVKRTVVAEAPQAKASGGRQNFASDIAAPAAPPPPPAVISEAIVLRQEKSATQPMAATAESAEDRLRSDAAARVGAVSALTASDQAAGFPEKAESVQRSVEAVNFDGAPLSAQSGYSLLSGVGTQTPRVVLRNETDKTVSSFALVWIVGDGAYQSRARIVRQDLAMASGEVTVTGGGDEWRSPSGTTNRMRVYVSSVAFEDGTTWSPATADIASKGLTAPVGVQELQPVGHNF